MIKKYLISFLYFIIPFIILLLIFSILYYFDIISNSFMKYLKFIILIISLFIGSYKIGKESNKLGYQKGLIFGSIIILLFIIISLITNNFKISNIIYYLLILIISTIGSMIGVLKKNKNAN